MSLRVAFMGSPAFAVPSLEAVARVCDLRVVVCQPDRPAGRGRKLTAPAVKAAAQALGVPVLQPVKMKDGSLVAALRPHDLDLALVVAFGRILPADLLGLPRHGCINVHGSVLPRWRGAAPMQRAVLAGDAETGISIMAMDEGLDTGAVHLVRRTAIGPEETSGELSARLAEIGAETLVELLADFPRVPPPSPQDDAAATHAPPLRKAEGRIDWARPARRVADHIRGMDPWPGAFTERAGGRLELFGARVAPLPAAPGSAVAPGTVLGMDPEGIRVACLDGAVTVREIKPASKSRMSARAYGAGRPFAPGDRLGERAADPD